MSVRIFNLRHVPDDEADDIRALLDDNGIDYYETPDGLWGISAGAFWLRDAAQKDRAKALIDAYQETRAASARAARDELRREGRLPSLLDSFRENPLQFIVFVGLALLVLYLSTKPFLDMSR
ncbi:MAG: hypothetical protein HKN49_10065 [Gammaproteobacteria bacterium]|nr:hypothetical protein [Gammaproteobacteria bacterium]